MRRFRKFLGKTLDVSKVNDKEYLENLGIKVRYAPDEVEDFDEFEFGIDFSGHQDVGFLVAIEKGKIARLLFGWTVPENPDMMKPMNDEDLMELLEKRGGVLERFFEFVTE